MLSVNAISFDPRRNFRPLTTPFGNPKIEFVDSRLKPRLPPNQIWLTPPWLSTQAIKPPSSLKSNSSTSYSMLLATALTCPDAR